MALSHKTRKRLAIVLLVVWLPAYIVAAITIIGMLDRPPLLVELGLYILLGVLWALPFKFVFLGVGTEAPDANDPAPSDPPDQG